KRATSPQVKQPATQISQAQGPEIAQMQAMLQSWGLPAQPTSSTGTSGTSGTSGTNGTNGTNGMNGMNGGSPSAPPGASGTPGMPGMPGMMSGQQMQQLSAATGTAFGRMFLQMMIQHHTGAIDMSQTELRDGRSPDAKALAQKIIDAQRAEVTQMQQLLTTI
ncbi:DUF305 domain-containing protein, partial [Pseudonocardia sp.]|uniref:DUF305 domain-containing protein n=1 Tax=Pseudonocardia sp. TaxID=60912 RepID=UPI00261896E1